jgi:hypothetical protein
MGHWVILVTWKPLSLYVLYILTSM